MDTLLIGKVRSDEILNNKNNKKCEKHDKNNLKGNTLTTKQKVTQNNSVKGDLSYGIEEEDVEFIDND